MAPAFAKEITSAPPRSDGLSEKDFARIAEIIGGVAGICLPSTKRLMVEGKLRRRASALGLPSIANYCALLDSSAYLAEELVHLIDAVTINKTDFFREPEHFAFLKQQVVPSFLADRHAKPDRLLKVWSAASSNGAEAYSIAMQLADLSGALKRFRFAVLGTDICTEVLAQAARAVYPISMIYPIPTDMQKRYLMRARGAGRGDVRITPELRRLCRFVRLNLMDASYPLDQDIDAIFLRNVLIYFDRATQDEVVSRVASHLRPGGHLLLGHSESMLGGNSRLRQVAPTIFERM